MVELLDSLSGQTRFAHFVQYLVAFCNRTEGASDVISGAAVDHVGVDVHVKFGDSRSSSSQDIRVADFALNDRTNENDQSLSQRSKKIILRLKMSYLPVTNICLKCDG